MENWKRPACADAACVEVSFDIPGLVRMRSAHSSLGILTFTYGEWDAFVAGVKNGEFDLPGSVSAQ